MMTNSRQEPLIRAEAASRIYPISGSRRIIGINRIDLRIDPGELVVVKGESGSGNHPGRRADRQPRQSQRCGGYRSFGGFEPPLAKNRDHRHP